MPTMAGGRSTDEMVAWLVDRAEISDLLHRFAQALDRRDWDAYEANFADDGELILPWGGHKGRVGMAAYVSRDLGRFAATHHISANHQVSVTGDTATSRSYLQAVHVLRPGDPASHFDVGGWYDNDYRRTAEGWRLTRVVITPVWESGTNPF